MKKLILGSLLSFTLLSADALKFEAGVGYHYTTLSDSLKQDSKSVYDDAETNSYFLTARVEHFIPLFPNFKTNIYSAGFEPTDVIQGVTFKDHYFAKGSKLDIDVKEFDLIFYYQILDNVVDLDAGVNFKVLDSYARMYNNGQSRSSSSTNIIPMVYGSASANLPMNLGATLDVGLSYYDDNTYHDVKAGVNYKTSFGAKFEVAYRNAVLKNYLAPIYSQVTLDSLMFSIYYGF